jgi:hypothetical protein
VAATRFTKIPKIPDIPEEERTPLVAELLDICCLQQELILSLREQIQVLRDEVARLKNQKPKPKIRPSSLENRPDKEKDSEQESKRVHSVFVDTTQFALLSAEQIIFCFSMLFPKRSTACQHHQSRLTYL